MSLAEKEELMVRKRREDGTPVTETSFTEWWAKFSAETAQKKEDKKAAAAEDSKDKKAADLAIVIEERLTGFQIFSEKSGMFNLEKLEAAAEEMENDTNALDQEDLGDVEEGLFDDDEGTDEIGGMAVAVFAI